VVGPALASSSVSVTITAASLLCPGPLAAPGVWFSGRTRTPVKFAAAGVATVGAHPVFCPATGRGSTEALLPRCGGVFETVPMTCESPGAGLYNTTGPAAISVRLTTLTPGTLA
jgi:hypothetical protein